MISKFVEAHIPFVHVGAFPYETDPATFRSNRRHGTLECRGAFQDWIADPLRGRQGSFGCKAANSPYGYLQEEQTCLYQRELIAENF